jgi:hypothetical protein
MQVLERYYLAMKTISLKMPEALDSELEDLARRTGRSKSLVVRMALAEFLPRRSRPSKRSFLTRAADLAGSVRAASDLSTNKRRLEGYGR